MNERSLHKKVLFPAAQQLFSFLLFFVLNSWFCLSHELAPLQAEQGWGTLGKMDLFHPRFHMQRDTGSVVGVLVGKSRTS